MDTTNRSAPSFRSFLRAETVNKTKISSSQKLGGCLQKASSLLSVAAILMTVSLFVRSETNTKMLDSKFTLKIQEMGDALESVRAACQVLREDRDISKGR